MVSISIRKERYSHDLIAESDKFDPCLFIYDADTLTELWHIGFDGGTAADKMFDFAADWETDAFFTLNGCFLPGGGKILCQYAYGRKSYWTDSGYRAESHLAFEVRDAKTGEILSSYYLPYAVRRFQYSPGLDLLTPETYTGTLYTAGIADTARGLLLVQDRENTVHVIDLHTGKELVSAAAETELRRFWFGDGEVRVWFAMAGSDDVERFAANACVLSYDGTVRAVLYAELEKPQDANGIYGDLPVAVREKGVYDVETGEALLEWTKSRYYFGTFADGKSMLFYESPDLIVLHYASPAELRELALRILDGRTLTQAQKEKYYLQ